MIKVKSRELWRLTKEPWRLTVEGLWANVADSYHFYEDPDPDSDPDQSIKSDLIPDQDSHHCNADSQHCPNIKFLCAIEIYATYIH